MRRKCGPVVEYFDEGREVNGGKGVQMMPIEQKWIQIRVLNVFTISKFTRSNICVCGAISED